jgi:hypothetical protein
MDHGKYDASHRKETASERADRRLHTWADSHRDAFNTCVLVTKCARSLRGRDRDSAYTTSIMYPDIKDALSLPFLARYVMQYIKGGISQQWGMGGQNLSDTRNQLSESVIGTSNVSQLVVKWVFKADGGVLATPAVVNGVVYFGDLAGNFYALNAANGALVWSHKVSDWTGIPGDRVRDDPAYLNDPAYLDDTLFIGD